MEYGIQEFPSDEPKSEEDPYLTSLQDEFKDVTQLFAKIKDFHS